MKNKIKNIILGVLALFIALPLTVSAAVFNNDPADLATTRVTNFTTSGGITTAWTTITSASVGQIISVAIYYHNTTAPSSLNTVIKLNQPVGQLTRHSFTGSVGASNAATVSGLATVNLTSAQTLTFIPGSLKWYPNQSSVIASALPIGQTEASIFTPAGLNIGTISAGWTTQGSVVARFQVGVAQPVFLLNITTNTATAITTNQATLNGSMSPAPTLGTSINRWFEWGTTVGLGNPTIQSPQAIGQTAFSSIVSNLQPNTTYYYRAVAQPVGGFITYGQITTFTTKTNPVTQISVFTNTATAITTNQATLNGSMSPAPTLGTSINRWFEWGTTVGLGNPTIQSPQAIGQTAFSSIVSNLQPNTTYYYRAVAQPVGGFITYGQITTFTTTTIGVGQVIIRTDPITGSGSSYAILNGFVNPLAQAGVSRWFQWGINLSSLTNTTTRIGQGTVASSYSETISNLQPNNTYYYRAVARNGAGQIVYGQIINFTTQPARSQSPTVITQASVNISKNQATLKGYVNPFRVNNTLRYFEWGISVGSLTHQTNKVNYGSTASDFQQTISNLQPNTTYYYRAVAQNGAGIYYGNIINFNTTGGTATPQLNVTTNGVSGITISKATFRGSMKPTPTASTPTTRWFEWGSNASLGHSTIKRTQIIGVSEFGTELSNLRPNTTYYYRAVSQNRAGTHYGNVFSFRTEKVNIVKPPVKPPKPIVIVQGEHITMNIDTANRVVGPGERVTYVIRYTNDSTSTLPKALLNVILPMDLTYSGSNNPNVVAENNLLSIDLGSLKAGKSGSLTFYALVDQKARDGDNLTVAATLSYLENATSPSKTVNDYAVSQVDKNRKANTANVFSSGFGGSGGFWLDEFIDWLILIIFITILILIIRYIFYGDKESVVVNRDENIDGSEKDNKYEPYVPVKDIEKEDNKV